MHMGNQRDLQFHGVHDIEEDGDRAEAIIPYEGGILAVGIYGNKKGGQGTSGISNTWMSDVFIFKD